MSNSTYTRKRAKQLNPKYLHVPRLYQSIYLYMRISDKRTSKAVFEASNASIFTIKDWTYSSDFCSDLSATLGSLSVKKSSIASNSSRQAE